MTQQERVLNYLKQNGSITSLEMFNKFFICCPQAVIRDIWEHKKRVECKSDGTKVTKSIKYKRYFLKKLEGVAWV